MGSADTKFGNAIECPTMLDFLGEEDSEEVVLQSTLLFRRFLHSMYPSSLI